MTRFSAITAALMVFTAVACAADSHNDGASSAAGLSASQHPGMGASLYDGGVSFRIWAPNAARVFVAGDFNGWNNGANELGNEFNGNFSGDVPGAQRYQKYQYWIVPQGGGNGFYKSDPRALRMENSSGASIIHDPGAYYWNNTGFKAPGFNETVIYEMHIGTFAPNYGHVGTWQSAMQKLDYLAGLGVNMLEVMPPAEFPGDVSAGYNPSEPLAPESAYGTPEDMKAFVDAAHGKGMGVIVDVVANHWGPNDLPMWCLDGNCLGNGGSYFYTDWRASTPWGNTRPDYGRQQVQDYIKDMAQNWLNEYRVDGLRWDGVKWIRTVSGDGSDNLGDQGLNMMKAINDACNQQPWKIKIAEDFGDLDFVSKQTGWGGMGFDSQWDGNFVHPVRAAVTAQNDSDRSMASVAASITHSYNATATQRVIYTENHDEDSNGSSRLPEQIWPGNADSWAARKRSTLAAGIAFTSPGIPMMFMGQEFNSVGYFDPQNGMDWSRANTWYPITQMYRDFAHLRRNWQNNTRGLEGNNVNVFHQDENSKVIAYHRWNQGGGGDDVVIVANFSQTYFPSYQVGFPRNGTWHVRLNSDWNSYSSDFGNTATLDLDANGGGMDGLGQSGSFALGPYSIVIFSQ